MRRLLTRRRDGSTAVGVAGLVAALLSLGLLAGACSDSNSGQAAKVGADAKSPGPSGPVTDAPGGAAIPAASPNEVPGAPSSPADSSPSLPSSSTVSAAPKLDAKEAAAHGPGAQ